jgi:hypothetical protein
MQYLGIDFGGTVGIVWYVPGGSALTMDPIRYTDFYFTSANCSGTAYADGFFFQYGAVSGLGPNSLDNSLYRLQGTPATIATASRMNAGTSTCVASSASVGALMEVTSIVGSAPLPITKPISIR